MPGLGCGGEEERSEGKFARRVDLKCSHQEKKWQLCEVMKVLTNVPIAIISQYISILNQHIVFLNLQNKCSLYINKGVGGGRKQNVSTFTF